MKSASLLVLLCACGSIEEDAAVDGSLAAGSDAAPAERCNGVDDDGDGEIDEGWGFNLVDGFEGTSLDPDWVTAVNQAPTFEVLDGRLLITDAAKAPTPSMGGDASWIYDVEQDLGNQLTRILQVGEGDFALDAEMFWDSQMGDQSLAGIGLTGLDHHLDLFVGLYDPTVNGGSGGTSGWFIVRHPGPTAEFQKSYFPGYARRRVRVHAERQGTTLTVTMSTPRDENDLDGPVDEVSYTEPMPQAIYRLAIVSVRGKYDAIPFGSFGLRHVALCANP